MKKIALTQGKFAIVDDVDYERLAVHSWCIFNSSNTQYAQRGHKAKGKCHTILMHREILNAPNGMLVDHVNGNGLDNRRCNLRLATESQNHFNQRKQKKRTSSRYKGVYWHKRDNVWVVRIQTEGKGMYIGSFKNEQEAALAYNEAALKYHGEYANLNEIEEEMNHGK